MSTAHNDLARRSTEGASDPEKGSDSVEQLEYTNNAGVPAISPEDDKRVLRKIDFRLLPIFCAIYALQFLDKTALTYTSVMGLMYETKVNTSEYSWLSSIFYLGYLVGSYPMCFLQQRLPLGKFTGINIFLWGAVVCATAACNDFKSLMAVRFLLGFFEASLAPALMIFTAQYYRVREQGTRTGIWSSFNTWGGILGAGVAYGLYKGQLSKSLAISSWRALFLFLGSATVFLGVLFFFFIPDSPSTAYFFNEDEKEIARLRTLENQQDLAEKTWQWYHVREAATDPQVWIFGSITLLSSIPAGGITSFYGILVTGLGFMPDEAILLSMVNCWVAIAVILSLWIGDKVKCRTLVSIVPTVISTVGAALVLTLPMAQKAARLAAFYLTLSFAVCMFATMSLITSNIAGRTKKTVVQAVFLIAFCVGNLIGPQTFRNKHAPRYAPALITIIACNCGSTVLLGVLYFYYKRENARRDKIDGPLPENAHDLTDRENPTFRYAC